MSDGARRWQVKIGVRGEATEVWVDGTQVYPMALTLTAAANELSELCLEWPRYGIVGEGADEWRGRRKLGGGDVFEAEGTIIRFWMKIGGKRYGLVPWEGEEGVAREEAG